MPVKKFAFEEVRKRAEHARSAATGAASVDRALSALLAFREGDQGLSLGEISRRTGLYKSTVLRLLGSLQHQHFVVRMPDGRYRLGPILLYLGSLYERSFDLRSAVQPVLHALAADTGESAIFYIRDVDRRLCLMRVDSRYAVRDHLPVGSFLPLDRGAAGHVLARYQNGPGDDTGEALVITSFGERDPELAAVAAPVFGPESKLLGALAVSGTVTRLADPEKLLKLKSVVLNGARQLAGAFGGDVSRYGVSAPHRRPNLA
jgi:DNA-binding IclR family transcriptional regulator